MALWLNRLRIDRRTDIEAQRRELQPTDRELDKAIQAILDSVWGAKLTELLANVEGARRGKRKRPRRHRTRGLRQASRKCWRCEARPRNATGCDQPSCQGRSPSRDRPGFIATEGRSKRSLADAKRSRCADLALLEISGKTDGPFRSLDRRLCRHARWGYAASSPYAEPGRSFVDLERGIFYRKPIGKRATKKRQTPAPIPPRLLAHMRRWKTKKLMTTSFVEFNGKPVASVKTGFRSAVRLAELSGATHALTHSGDVADAARCLDLGSCGVPWNVARGTAGALRPPPPGLSAGCDHRDWAKRSIRFGG
jgi:hypothetical protein